MACGRAQFQLAVFVQIKKLEKSVEMERKKVSELQQVPEKCAEEIKQLEDAQEDLVARKEMEEKSVEKVMENIKCETEVGVVLSCLCVVSEAGDCELLVSLTGSEEREDCSGGEVAPVAGSAQREEVKGCRGEGGARLG